MERRAQVCTRLAPRTDRGVLLRVTAHGLVTRPVAATELSGLDRHIGPTGTAAGHLAACGTPLHSTSASRFSPAPMQRAGDTQVVIG